MLFHLSKFGGFGFVIALEPTELPSFTSQLSNVMARAGQKVRLECAVSGLPFPSVHWLHNNKPLKETRDTKVFRATKQICSPLSISFI